MTNKPSRHFRLATIYGTLYLQLSSKGLCLASFSKELVLEDNKEDFHTNIAEIQKAKLQLNNFINNSQVRFKYPLVLHGTNFQKQVWNELIKIPRGQTRSYSQIAYAIGKPKAYRAVANACSANKLALVVPCHRVICSSGSIGGYRWGTKLKSKLLKKEGACF